MFSITLVVQLLIRGTRADPVFKFSPVHFIRTDKINSTSLLSSLRRAQMLFKSCRDSSILSGEEAFGMVPLGESLMPNTEHLRAPMEELKKDVKKRDQKEAACGEDGCSAARKTPNNENFFAASLVAASPQTMDKAMVQIDLKKPKVIKKRSLFNSELVIPVLHGEV